LWEICSDATLCANTDADMGLSFSTPIITKRNDGTTPIVIVASGYNNVTPGNGAGYLYVLNAATGAVLEKITTGVGDTTTPSGFAKITGFAINAAQDNKATLVYGGDLMGNVWRYDMSATPVTVQRIAQLKDGSTPPRPQSITTRPEVTQFNAGFNVVYFGTGRLLGGTDLGDPASLAPPEPYAFQQSIYAIKDTGADLGNARLPAAGLVQQIMSGTTTRTITNNTVDFTIAGVNGWYVDLNPGSASPGERVNLDPTLVKGVLIVTTNEPNTQACSDGGNGFLYQLSYNSGAYIPGTPGGVAGGQIASSLLVGSVFYRTTTGALVGLTRSSTGAPIKTPVSSGGGGGSGQRVSWRELVQ
jgi:type IV pilus assembly protein PilY1